MRLMIITICALAALALAGCANHRPIVDMKGVDPVAYERDLAQCQDYARQVSVAGKSAVGAAAGAVVGGLVGAAVGNSRTAERSAGAGAAVGAAKGTARGAQEQQRVIRNCLRNRGYAVLN